MNAAHTPGPWVTQPEEVGSSYVRIRGTQLGFRFKVANVLTPTFEEGYVLSTKLADMNREETRANARLIAAAPELLEALREAIAWIPCGPESWHTDSPRKAIEAARSAIAKATGEQA